jgi:hypothetical protein
MVLSEAHADKQKTGNADVNFCNLRFHLLFKVEHALQRNHGAPG